LSPSPTTALLPYTTLFRSSKTTKETFVSGDGEGYALHIQPVDDPKAWERLALPYVGEEAKERRRDVLWPWAIREAKHESDGLKEDRKSTRLNSSHVKISYA